MSRAIGRDDGPVWFPFKAAAIALTTAARIDAWAAAQRAARRARRKAWLINAELGLIDGDHDE